eukprot:9686190-Alexandrium_andersonii.AAC.1
MSASLVGSEMCIRDRSAQNSTFPRTRSVQLRALPRSAASGHQSVRRGLALRASPLWHPRGLKLLLRE